MMTPSLLHFLIRGFISLVLIGWSVVFWPFRWPKRRPASSSEAMGDRDAGVTVGDSDAEIRQLEQQMRSAASRVDDDPGWRERVFKLIEDDPLTPEQAACVQSVKERMYYAENEPTKKARQAPG